MAGENKPTVVVTGNDAALTLAQKEARKLQVAETETQRETERLTKENLLLTQRLGVVLKELYDMAHKFPAETMSGFTHAAGLLGDIVKFASLYGEAWTIVLNEELRLNPSNQGVKGLYNRWSESVKNSDPVVLGTLSYVAKLDENGKLSTQTLSLEGISLTPANQKGDALKKLIDTCTVKWLKEEHQYVMGRDGQFYLGGTSASPLTTEAFERLKNNSENGLIAYLEKEMRINLEDKDQPTPPTPGLTT